MGLYWRMLNISMSSVAQFQRLDVPKALRVFSYATKVRSGDSERCEAVKVGDPDMNFGNLAVEIANAQVLSQ